MAGAMAGIEGSSFSPARLAAGQPLAMARQPHVCPSEHVMRARCDGGRVRGRWRRALHACLRHPPAFPCTRPRAIAGAPAPLRCAHARPQRAFRRLVLLRTSRVVGFSVRRCLRASAAGIARRSVGWA